MKRKTAISRVRRAIESAEHSQTTINAFTSIDRVGALTRAAKVDELDDTDLALAGVPIGLKDLIDQAGRVTTCGSAFYRQMAERNASVVDRLESSGGVIVGRTGLHEFAFGFSSENPHFGPVRNPWDLSTSVGGSSGGSAAAVAAGVTPIAIGTDTGGSVRVPAALCGCYGLKTTFGSIPLDGVFPLVASIDTVGPLADSVDSLEMSYRVMAGDLRSEPKLADPMRLGVPQPWVDDAPIDPTVAAIFDDTITRLRNMGHTVETAPLELAIPSPLILDAIAEEVTSVHASFRRQGRPYGPDVAARLDDAELVGPEASAVAHRWQAELRAQFAKAFEQFDFLITPTVPVVRKSIGDEMLLGRHYRTVLSWFTALVNHALCPAIAMPILGSGEPPTSLQAIGPVGSDLRLLSLGKRLEIVGLVGFRAAPASFSSLEPR